MNRFMTNTVMLQLNMTGAGPQKKAAFEKCTLCQIIQGKHKPTIVIVVFIPKHKEPCCRTRCNCNCIRICES